MFVWQRRAGAGWLAANEHRLSAAARARLAVIKIARHKGSVVEVAGTGRRELEKLREQFGGAIKTLPRKWLHNAQEAKAKPIRIGKRLIITRPPAAAPGQASLVIPAGAAFGTGEHATTAMSLRLLEQISRKLKRGWSMLDLGTGSGILALAAKRFGARKVVAIDLDPMAISTAKGNARLNRISGIDFRIADGRKFCSRTRFSIVTANLFSELLLEILPKLRGHNWLILSGILREQENNVMRALKRNAFNMVQTRRRGKWLALLVIPSGVEGSRGSYRKGFAAGSLDFAALRSMTAQGRRKVIDECAARSNLPALGRLRFYLRKAVDQGRRSGLCPTNFPTPSSRHTRCASRAPAGSCRG